MMIHAGSIPSWLVFSPFTVIFVVLAIHQIIKLDEKMRDPRNTEEEIHFVFALLFFLLGVFMAFLAIPQALAL